MHNKIQMEKIFKIGFKYFPKNYGFKSLIEFKLKNRRGNFNFHLSASTPINTGGDLSNKISPFLNFFKQTLKNGGLNSH